MSGIDEQPEVELKCRVFFRMGDLLETLKSEDFAEGDVFFLDEDIDTQAYNAEIENIRKFARAEKIIVTHSYPVLQNLVKLVKRIGIEQFKRDWF